MKLGLTEQEVLKSRQEHGDNRLSEIRGILGKAPKQFW